MEVLRKRTRPEREYITSCASCGEILKVTESELSELFNVRHVTSMISYAACNNCNADLSVRIYPMNSSKANEVLAEIS